METKWCLKIWVVVVAVTAMYVFATAPGYAATLYDDAVSYWKFDDGSGGTATDSRGSNAGTLTNGPVWAIGKVGGALDFDGEDDIINIPSSESLNIENEITFSAWVKPGSGEVPIAEYNVDSLDRGVQFWLYHGPTGKALYLNVRDVTYDDNVVSNHADIVPLYEWSHVAGTYDGSDVVLYLNGENVAIQTIGSFTLRTIDDLTIGGINWADYHFDGSIDEVAIWNRALSLNEIDALYKTGFISSAMSTLSLSYTTDQINQLANLYLNQAGPVTIGDSVWSYVAHTDPIWDGHRTVGATFNVGGVNYLYLGGGISHGPLGGGVPEPSSMAVTGLAIGLLGLIKRFRRTKDHRP